MSKTIDIILRWREEGSKTIKAIQSRLKSLSKTVFNLRNVLAGGLGLYGLSKAFEKATREAEAEEEAIRSLHQTLVSMGRYSPTLETKLLRLANALEVQAGYSNDAIIAAEKFLLTFKGINEDVLPRAIRLTLDLSRGWGVSLKSAAAVLGKASEGLTGELRRYGISVDAATYKTKGFVGVLEEIEQQVGGQVQALEYSTKVIKDRFSATLGDVYKQFGYIANDLLNPLRQATAEWFVELATGLEKWRQNTVNVSKAHYELAIWTGKALDATESLWEKLKNLRAWVKSVDSETMGVGLVGYLIGGAKGTAGLLVIDHYKKKLEEFLSIPRKSIPQAFKEASNAWADVLQSIFKGKTAIKELENVISGARASMEADWESIVSAGDEAMMRIVSAAQKIQQYKASGWVRVARDWARSIVSSIREAGQAIDQNLIRKLDRLKTQIASSRADMEHELRAMRREHMSPQEAAQDLAWEASEMLSQSREAMEKKQYDLAQEYARKAKSLYEELARTSEDRWKEAYYGVEDAWKAILAAQEAQKKEAEQAVGAQVKQVQELGAQWGDVTTKAQIYVETLEGAPQEITIEAKGLKELLKKLDELRSKPTVHEVVLKTVEQKAVGGLVGLARGGKLPGWGGGDRIKALLEPGEFVIRKEAVAHYGAGLFEALNRMKLNLQARIPRLDLTGSITPPRLSVPKGKTSQPVQQEIHINLHLPSAAQKLSARGRRLLEDLAEEISMAMARGGTF